MNLTVLGAGAWGTALAVSTASRHPTCLWARDEAQVALMRCERRNDRYLRDVLLPAPLLVTPDFEAALDHAREGLLVVATPTAALEQVLRRLPSGVRGVVWLCKGFQQGTGRLAHEVASAVSPGLRVGVLSGPSFAIEVAEGRPTALVVGSASGAVRELTVEALHSESLRIYTSDDPTGVEVGGAVKNVLAIATGIADGMPREAGMADRMPSAFGVAGDARGLGLNARAALVTRGLAEMTRLGVALGARAETFMGLSGLGDLVLTTTGDLSRNRKVGWMLAQGLSLTRILADLGHVAEGVLSAPMVLRRARDCGIEMPIAEAVVGVLEGAITPRQALERLMGRGARAEA